MLRRRLTGLPFFVILMGIGAGMMLVPALHALDRGDFRTARIFLYGAILSGMLTLLIGIATRGYRPQHAARSHLVTLFAAFGLLPLMLALPFYETVVGARLVDAWFEMVSAMTTTGATLWDRPVRLNASVHLWRALVGWLGGFLTWLMAIAILAPLNIGGFEVTGRGGDGQTALAGPRLDPSERLAGFALQLAPIYAGLTALLWLGLMLAGERSTPAFIHAAGVISTSGITSFTGLEQARSGFGGEVLILAFWVFALSRHSFTPGSSGWARGGTAAIRRDVELRLALALICLATLLIFLRHLAIGPGPGDGPVAGAATGFLGAMAALWGIFFTAASFLTTTGYESRIWHDVLWLNHPAPGLLLMGLALVGGGVATTAGGVKLFRLYALLRHAQRETERLILPDSIGGGGAEARRIRRAGAAAAWLFFMLYAVSILIVMAALSLTGLQFETALTVTVSAITTTGNVALVAGESPVFWSGLPDSARAVAAAAMVLGRLEMLALIALANPDFWKR